MRGVVGLDRPVAADTAPPLSAVALQDVEVEIAGRRILDGVNLPLAPGTITCLIGPSGGGKTLCVKFLSGVLRPTAGRVLVGPRDISSFNARELRAYRRRLGVMFQGSMIYEGALFGSLNIFQNVAFPLVEVLGMRGPEVEERVMARLHDVGLAAEAELMPSDLSGGMVRRAALARALVADPEVILLDDLDSGIDGVRLHGIARAIREARDRSNAAILAVTHDPQFALDIADQIALLRQGRIVALDTPEAVLGGADPDAFSFLAGNADASGLEMAPEEVGAARIASAPASPEPLEHLRPLYGVVVMLVLALMALAWVQVVK